MRAISILLIASLLAVSSVEALEQEAANWQKVAAAIPLGTKVKVQTLDGKRLSGTLISVDEKSVQVKRNSRRPEAAVTVTFENISNMERDNGGGMHWGKALAIGFGAAGAVIVTLVIIGLQLD